MGGVDEHQCPQVVSSGQHGEQLVGIPVQTVDVAPHHDTNETVDVDAPLQFGDGCGGVLEGDESEPDETVGVGGDHLGDVVVRLPCHRYTCIGVELVPMHQRA